MTTESLPDRALTDPLAPGEWQLFCEYCDYEAEKNCAHAPKCPECGAHLWIRWEE